MRLRVLPIVITAAVSSSVLFGGWFVYHAVAMEEPLLAEIISIEGVLETEADIRRDQVDIAIELSPDAQLAEVYPAVKKAVAKTAGNRAVEIAIRGDSSKALDSLWSTLLFDIAQAMDTMQYARIPERLQEAVQESGSGITATAQMDEEYVYITLKDEASSKYIVLPRRPQPLGVWRP